MIGKILIYYNWKIRPKIKGFLFKFFYSGKQIHIGKHFKCDTFPDIWLTGNAKISIGDDVIFRRNVDIRAHKEAKISIENNVRIDKFVRILASNSAQIHIQEGARIGCNSVLNGGDSINVGKKCLISGFVYLQTSMHKHEGEKNIQDQGFDHAEITLGDDVWLGTHATVLPGCTIHPKAIVGSNAVVTKNVETKTVVTGIPAKPIKTRN
ncbi:MAG: acyltransferase [Bacteroidales bacterium]|jgi:maltose O-acetyltransferase|nr:acyltransferase [Bacteroidales bacterium]